MVKPKINIKKGLKITFILSSILSLFFVPWILVWSWILPLPDTIQEQVNEAVSHGFDGMIVYVDQKGKPSKTYTAGWHNKEKQIPAKPNALFKIGSITKLYVAAATAKLVNSNKLSLDKTVADYLPELTNRIKYANKITLRMLVQHRSGIPNYTDTPGFWENPIKENNKALS